MKKLTEAQIEKYWADIPQGAANPATYGELMKKWRCGRRYARYILSVLSVWDNGESKDGKDSVTAALHELERFGYISRVMRKNEKGQYAGYEYIVHDFPLRG